jgi:U3 small nucleolar RNA-associated protein 20
LSILRFFAGVMDHLRQKQAERYLVHVLSPIYRILDEGGDLTAESGAQIGEQGGIGETHTLTTDDLKQLATEVRDLVQNKVGTSMFSRTWESMRQKVAGKREERRDARNRLVSLRRSWAPSC